MSVKLANIQQYGTSTQNSAVKLAHSQQYKTSTRSISYLKTRVLVKSHVRITNMTRMWGSRIWLSFCVRSRFKVKTPKNDLRYTIMGKWCVARSRHYPQSIEHVKMQVGVFFSEFWFSDATPLLWDMVKWCIYNETSAKSLNKNYMRVKKLTPMSAWDYTQSWRKMNTWRNLPPIPALKNNDTQLGHQSLAPNT